MIVISNSSPLIAIARIKQLEILCNNYSELIVPHAVWNEVVLQGENKAGVEDIKSAQWIKTATVKNTNLVLSLKQNLGAGEAESIALALELQADLLLMDERLGRETARFLNVPHIGVIGLLVQAKHNGYITEVKSYMDKLRQRASFHISDSLYHRVLKDEGEL